MKYFIVFLFTFLPIHSTDLSNFEMGVRYANLQRENDSLAKKTEQLKEKMIELKQSIEALEEGRFIVDAPNLCLGRLTLESGVPLSTTNQTNRTTIYFTPYNGNVCSFYNGSLWLNLQFSETSLALGTLASGANYDVFAYNNAGTLALEMSAAWASATSRTDALTTVDGVSVKSSDTTRRYLGTFRTTSTTQTEFSTTRRYLWNAQNRLPSYLHVADGTNTYTYQANTWRQANASAANAVSYVVGLNETLISSRCLSVVTGGSNYYACGIGIDSTTTNSATVHGVGASAALVQQTWGEYHGYPGLGYHAINWLEISDPGTAFTVWGDNGDNTRYQSGLIVEWEG